MKRGEIANKKRPSTREQGDKTGANGRSPPRHFGRMISAPTGQQEATGMDVGEGLAPSRKKGFP